MPPYERNNFVHFSAPLRMKCHRDWKKICDGIPSFIYEYRYYVDMYCDLSQMRVSYETSRDMKALTDVDFNGCISDQTHRMYMPTGLPLITMGNTLFDKSTDFETLKNEHFAAAFGNNADLAKNFLDELLQRVFFGILIASCAYGHFCLVCPNHACKFCTHGF